MSTGRNSHALELVRRPLVLELHDIASASELADERAARSGMMLADLECRHGNLEPCDDCEKGSP